MMKNEIWEYPSTRRGFFRQVGSGGIGLGMALLALQLGTTQARANEGDSRRAWRGYAGQTAGNLTNGNAAGLQLPFWSNGARWNDGEYYSTIQAHRRSGGKTYQSSDIDGDGEDELIGRHAGGIAIVKYNATLGQWLDMPDGPYLSDAGGWFQPEYYETIQCADIDGDGQAEIVARASNGLAAWRYDNNSASPAYRTWIQLANGPEWSDALGWGKPQYYETIQCADIDGDGRAEAIARGFGGIEAWKYDPASNSWSQMPGTLGLSDAAGWNRPEYYSTIQFGDINSDGAAELVARSAAAIQAWRYDRVAGAWVALANGPNWGDAQGFKDPTKYGTIQLAAITGANLMLLAGRTATGVELWQYIPSFNSNPDGWIRPAFVQGLTDASGWNKIEYSSTIQFADIDGDGNLELIARSAAGIQAWDIVMGAAQPLPNGPAWGDNQGWNVVEQYSTINTAKIKNLSGQMQYVLVGRSPLAIHTYLYNPNASQWSNTSATFPAFTTGQTAAYQALTTALGSNTPIRERYGDLSGILGQWYDQLTANSIPKPGGIAQADWDAITGQIKTELNWVILVQDRYATRLNNLITEIFLGRSLSLQTIGDYMSIPGNDPTKLQLSIADTVANGIRSIFSFFPPPFNIIGSIAGAAATAISAAQTFMPNGGNAYQVAYAQLSADLANSFNATLTGNLTNLSLITGTTMGGSPVPGDYGLLAAIGQNIVDGTWAWPESDGQVIAAAQRGYGISLWQTLSFAKWDINGGDYPPGYPQQYGYNAGGNTYYIGNSDSTSYPIATTLGALLDPNPGGGATFPLGATLSNVYLGQQGWDIPTTYQLATPLRTRTLAADIRVDNTQLRRDPQTKEIVATITLTNRGLTAATNILVTSARLRARRLPTFFDATALNYRPHLRLAAGGSRTIDIRFPAETPVNGMLLNLTARYKGGTCGFNVPLSPL